MKKLGESLAESRAEFARRLHVPGNIGIVMREVRIGESPPRDGLLIWVDGLASEAAHGQWFPSLARIKAETTLPEIALTLPVQQTELARDYTTALNRILAGWTALLVDGEGGALLLSTRRRPEHAPERESDKGQADVFGRELAANVTLLRDRLRSAELLALPVPVPPQRAGGVAMVYLKGKADPLVLRAVRRWASCHAGEEAETRGLINPASAALGLLSRFDVTTSADKGAAAVDAGFILLLVDRLEHAYIAPVTLAGVMTSPSDVGLNLPIRRWLVPMRLLFTLLVMLLPGTVVALTNYHHEMIPTAFLLAIGSARESAPFGSFFEVLFLELATEIYREASSRLPQAIPIGAVAITYALTALLAVQTGFVGPLPALAALFGSVASLALPAFGLTYLVRFWRYLFLLAAVILGFFGMATIFVLLGAYLCQVRSWGVPFLGPSGPNLTTPEASSSQRPRTKGGRNPVKKPNPVR